MVGIPTVEFWLCAGAKGRGAHWTGETVVRSRDDLQELVGLACRALKTGGSLQSGVCRRWRRFRDFLHCLGGVGGGILRKN